jgi:hypothetical protein
MYCLLQVVECSGVGGNVLGTEAMTCQELLALSGALSAALPTGQLGLGSFFTSLSKGGKLLQKQLTRTQKGLPGPLLPFKSKLKKKTDFLDTIISKVLHDLHSNQNQPLKSDVDY